MSRHGGYDAMASSGVTRVVRASGYAAAASDPYVRHEGQSQGKRPRGRGAWRAGRDAEQASGSAPSGGSNPLARGKANARAQQHNQQHSGRRRGGRQARGAARSGRGRAADARRPAPTATSGELNEDLDAYFQGTLEESGSTAAPSSSPLPDKAAPRRKAAPATPPSTAADLDDMLHAYMGAAKQTTGAVAAAGAEAAAVGDNHEEHGAVPAQGGEGAAGSGEGSA